MKIIAPSVLSANMYDLKTDIQKLKKHNINHIHFDVMDGHFVPNISYGSKILADLKKAEPDLFVDAHLMISKPDIYWEDFVKAKADLITIHAETLSLSENKIVLNNIRKAGVKTGIAINPKTPIETVINYIGLIDQVIVMSVEPGFGGQSFIGTSVQKIKELYNLREKFGAGFTIMVDGGINAETSKWIYEYVDIFVAGSYIFGSKNIGQAIERLR